MAPTNVLLEDYETLVTCQTHKEQIQLVNNTEETLQKPTNGLLCLVLKKCLK